MSLNAWGFHVGNYRQGNYNIPVVLSTEKGGFCLHYSKNDQSIAEMFIENIILNFAAYVSLEALEIHLWDYAIHKRFPYLAEIGRQSRFHIAQNSQSANAAFMMAEGLLKQRHRQILDIDTPTINDYNAKNPTRPQSYHLIIINGDDYPTEQSDLTRWQYFFEAAARAGIFIIMFSSDHRRRSGNSHPGEWLKSQLPAIYLKDQEWSFAPETFEFHSLREWYPFIPIQLPKKKVLGYLFGKTQYTPTGLLGENFAEYGDLISDVISDLEQVRQEKMSILAAQARLEAARQHHHENFEQREISRRERMQFESEKLERLLEMRKKAEEDEARYLAIKKARAEEALIIQRREQAEKEYYEQEMRRLEIFKRVLSGLVGAVFLMFLVAFSVRYLTPYRTLAIILDYLKFSVLTFFIFFFIGAVLSYKEITYQSVLKRTVVFGIYYMLAVCSCALSVLSVCILMNVIPGNLDQFLLMTFYSLTAFFIFLVLFRK